MAPVTWINPIALQASGLIESVEQVVITIGTGATSNTATITSVDTSRSHLIFQGYTTTNTTAADANKYCSRIELTNATTVTAYRNTSDATYTTTVRAVVIQWKSGKTSSIQQGTITCTGAASNTATISSVTTTNSAIFYLGHTTTDTTANQLRHETRVNLTDATTVTATRESTTNNVTVGYVVVQWASGVLNSNTQTGTIVVTGTSNTATISSVTTGQTMLAYGGRSTSSTNTSEAKLAYMELTNGTTITATRLSATNDVTLVYTVVEFKSADVTSLQRNTVTVAATATTGDATVSSVGSKAFVNYCGYTTDINLDPAENHTTLHLQAATTVRASRGVADASLTTVASFEVVELT